MQGLTQPILLKKIFAEDGDKNTLPVDNTDQDDPVADPSEVQRADLTVGFPPITSERPENGGLPPERKDFNGLGYLTTSYDYFYQAGGTFTYNATIASAIGGYPQNARLWYTDANGNTTVLRSTKNDNTDNFVTTPSYIGTSWVPEIPALGWNNTWTGVNTFTGNAIFKDGDLSKWGSYTLGTTPASNIFNQYHLKDVNGTVTGAFEQSYASDGAFTTRIVCKSQNGSNNSSFGVGWDGSGNEIIYGSSGVKKALVNLGMPNYSSGQSRSASTNYTATSNGFLYVITHRSSGSEGKIKLKIGNTTLKISSQDYDWNSCMFPVANGSTYSYTIDGVSTDSSSVTYYPCLGG